MDFMAQICLAKVISFSHMHLEWPHMFHSVTVPLDYAVRMLNPGTTTPRRVPEMRFSVTASFREISKPSQMAAVPDLDDSLFNWTLFP